MDACLDLGGDAVHRPGGLGPGRYENLVGAPAAEVEAFLAELQQAVRTGDKAGAAALVDFPLAVNGPGETRRSVKDAAAFIRDYEAIFTPGVRQAVLDQRFADLFRNSNGAMIGDGEIWFSVVGEPGRLAVYAVNRE